MNKVTRLYQDLNNEIKNKGYKLYHGKRTQSAAICRHSRKFIHIDKTIKDTLYGCYTLGHELGHICDYLDNKFPDYDHLNTFKGKEMPVSYVRKLEQSPTKFGRKILEDRGFKINHWQEFDKEWFEKELDEWWLPFYNGIRIGKKYEETKTYRNRQARNRRKSRRSCCKNHKS